VGLALIAGGAAGAVLVLRKNGHLAGDRVPDGPVDDEEIKEVFIP
jgi:hypothetical protein